MAFFGRRRRQHEDGADGPEAEEEQGDDPSATAAQGAPPIPADGAERPDLAPLDEPLAPTAPAAPSTGGDSTADADEPAASGDTAAPSPAAAPATPLTVRAPDGKLVQVSQEAFAERLLPAQLAADAGDIEKLAPLVALALRTGLADRVVETTAGLVADDPSSDRAVVLHGVALLQLERFAEAEALLAAHDRAHPPVGPVLTNLAKAIKGRGGRDREALEVARRAIEAEPDQENGLAWYSTLAGELDGPDARRAALEWAATLPGSWRPQLLLAVDDAGRGVVEPALASLRDLVAREADRGEILLVASGALGNAGRFGEAVELITPRYDPARHDPRIGTNLVESCLRLGRLDEAERIVRELGALERPDVAPLLAPFVTRINAAKAAASGAVPAAPTASASADGAAAPAGGPQRIDIRRIADPLWWQLLDRPQWLVPAPAPDAPRVVVLPLAVPSRKDLPAGSSTVPHLDEVTSLSRALPAALADALRDETDAAVELATFLLPTGGLVVFGDPPAGPALEGIDRTIAEAAGTGPADVVVTGSVTLEGGDMVALTLDLWRPGAAEPHATVERFTPVDASGELAAAAIDEVLDRIADLGVGRRTGPSPLAPIVPGNAGREHLIGTDRLLQLHLASSGGLTPDKVTGVPAQLGFLFDVADRSQAAVAALGFFGALSAAKRLGATTADEFADRAVGLVATAPDGSPLALLTPWVLRLVGQDDACTAALDQARAAADEGVVPDADGYRAWLAAI